MHGVRAYLEQKFMNGGLQSIKAQIINYIKVGLEKVISGKFHFLEGN